MERSNPLSDKDKKFEEWARDRWCDVTDDFLRSLIRMSAREGWDAHAELDAEKQKRLRSNT
jgi:hypothetical protein